MVGMVRPIAKLALEGTTHRPPKKPFNAGDCTRLPSVALMGEECFMIGIIYAIWSFISLRIKCDTDELARTCRPIDRGLDVLVILDGSGSVGGNTFDTQIAMLDRIVDTAIFGPDKTRLAVLQYASYTKVEFNFNDFETREQYKEAIGNIRYMSGTTRTGRALQKAFETFSEEHGARIRDNSVAQ
uniref:VWFA domain-containing protein n=1 Tax=Romanomermis culicivorax TaxID=13658 RepID=A0A915HV07_ROMCU